MLSLLLPALAAAPSPAATPPANATTRPTSVTTTATPRANAATTPVSVTTTGTPAANATNPPVSVTITSTASANATTPPASVATEAAVAADAVDPSVRGAPKAGDDEDGLSCAEQERAFFAAQNEAFERLCAAAAAAWNVNRDRSYICVNWIDPRAPQAKLVHAARKRADEHILFSSSHTRVGVWYQEGGQVAAELSGTPGHPQTIYIDESAGPAAKKRGATCPQWKPAASEPRETDFLPRTPEAGRDYLTLTVKYTSGPTVPPFTVEYLFEREYWGAFRTGFGLSFAPWDAEYTLVSGDATNPGKRIALKDGGPPGGIAALELQVGVSFFPGRVREHSHRPQFGLYAGLGLGSASAKGVGFLSSLGVGPELVIGPRFSIGLLVGLRFTRRLEAGRALGDAVESTVDVVPTRFGVTPQFGILLNITPQAVAFVRKGGG